MELTSLVTAAAIGLVTGTSGWFLLPEGRRGYLWPVLVTAVGAALAGTLVAAAAGVARTPGVDWLELSAQLGFAVVGVAVYARLTGRRTSRSGTRRTR
ncbi:hypothetical protein [Trujillonella humicola]|uniref:hypothetical protein n=1 Tax=Trujillonella humicola TaxID=3383699 RepID=UPI00390604EB